MTSEGKKKRWRRGKSECKSWQAPLGRVLLRLERQQATLTFNGFEWQAVNAGSASEECAGKRPFLYCSCGDVVCHASVRAGAFGCQNRKTRGQAWLPSMLLWHMTKALLSPEHKSESRSLTKSDSRVCFTYTGKGWLTFGSIWVLERFGHLLFLLSWVCRDIDIIPITAV